MAAICIHGWIEGSVQGVGFRRFVEIKALSLSLTGWVRNLNNGQVEVLMCGEAQSVQAMIAWLNVGPEKARVRRVVTHAIPFEEHLQFEVR